MNEPKRRGRPPKEPDAVKRHPLWIRTSLDLKERMEAAAAATGKSVAQEIEARLERSFLPAESHIALPLDLAAAMIRLAEARTGQRWNEDLATWVAAKKAIDFMMTSNRPAAPNQPAIAEAEDEFTQQMQRWTAATPIEQLLTGSDKKLKDGANPGLLNFEAEKAAQEELDQAQERLREAARPAREMFLEGQSIAEDIADLFRLRPRQD